ncbi:MAG: hypothetical protein ABJE47_22130 [bacterium]
MTITVKFRGPILFVHDGNGSLVEALIPNAETGGNHDDGDTAKAHLAGMLVLGAAGKFLRRLDLLDTTVSITEQGANAPAGLDATFGHKVALGFMVNNGAASDGEVTLDHSRARLSASIVVNGGNLVRAENLTQTLFPIPEHLQDDIVLAQKLPILTTWTSAKPVTIDIAHKNGVKETPLVLSKGEQVYIYNWDHDEPEPSQTRLEAKMDESHIMDVRPEADFKWLYKLLAPPSGLTWAEWIAMDKHKSLPAPLSTILTSVNDLDVQMCGMFPPNSACDGAKWP